MEQITDKQRISKREGSRPQDHIHLYSDILSALRIIGGSQIPVLEKDCSTTGLEFLTSCWGRFAICQVVTGLIFKRLYAALLYIIASRAGLLLSSLRLVSLYLRDINLR